MAKGNESWCNFSHSKLDYEMPMVTMIHSSCYFCSESNARSEYVLMFCLDFNGYHCNPSHEVSCHPVEFYFKIWTPTNFLLNFASIY